MDVDGKLESLARWLNAHPGEWKLWPWRLPSIEHAERILQRIQDHEFDMFRVDTVLLESRILADGFGPGVSLELRVIA